MPKVRITDERRRAAVGGGIGPKERGSESHSTFPSDQLWQPLSQAEAMALAKRPGFSIIRVVDRYDDVRRMLIKHSARGPECVRIANHYWILRGPGDALIPSKPVLMPTGMTRYAGNFTIAPY